MSVGSLVITNNSALGGTAVGTTVETGATLELQNVDIGGEPITLSGGTLSASIGTNLSSGGILLTKDSTISVSNGATLSLSGAITTLSSGSVGLTQDYYSANYFADNLTFFSSNTVTGTSVVTSISGLNDNSQAKSDYYS